MAAVAGWASPWARRRYWIPWILIGALLLISGPPDTYQVGVGASALVVAPDGRMLYVADGGHWVQPSGSQRSPYGHTVTPIDLVAQRVGKPIEIANPVGLAITPDGRKLYVRQDFGHDDVVIAPLDLATGKAEPTLRFPGGAALMLMSPDGRTLYVSAGDGGNLLVPVDVATGRQRAPFRLREFICALAATPDGKTIFAGSFDVNHPGYGDVVTPVDTATGRAGTPIRVPNDPRALAIAPDGRTLYVAGNDDAGPFDDAPHSLTAITVATGKVSENISLRPGPGALVMAPDGRVLYIESPFSDAITPVDVATGEMGRPISTAPLFKPGPGLSGIAIAPDGRTLYAIDQWKVAVIPAGG